MIIYSVQCHVKKEVADRWEKYFIEKHLDDVYNSGCFTGYTFRKELGEPDTLFVSEYHCISQDKLAEYNAHHAKALKEDIMSKFKGQFTAERHIYQLVCSKKPV